MKWKNIASDTTTYFITATITEWQPLFDHNDTRVILLQDLEFYRKKYECRILAYVIMPEHYHIVLQLNQAQDLHGWLRDVNGHTAKELYKWLRGNASCNELAVYEAHANGSADVAIWKEQARAVGIVSERVLKTKIEYIHNNPIRRGLVSDPADWQWSSWRNYYLDDDSIFRVDRVELF